MSFTDVARKLDDGLHALYLALDVLVEVFFFNFEEGQEVDGANITCLGILWNEMTESLIHVLGKERRV